jgi:chaperone BCS1
MLHYFPNEYWFVLFLQVTLSGLLNAMDGLWSGSGDERIIVFTTNHKDRLDPALLRPGRMDMHINLSFCTVNSFRILASNYLDVQTHPLFEPIEGLLEKLEVSPASVAEELMKSDDADVALGELIEFLKRKEKMGGDEIEASESKQSCPLSKKKRWGVMKSMHLVQNKVQPRRPKGLNIDDK